MVSLLIVFIFSSLIYAQTVETPKPKVIPGVVAANQDEQMTWSDKELQTIVAKTCLELKGPAYKALKVIDKKNADAIAMLIKKQEELEKRRIPIVDWNSQQGQETIKTWFEKNSPSFFETYLKNNGYVKKDELDKVSQDLAGVQMKIGELSTSVVKNTMDIAQISQMFVWVTTTGSDGTTYQVPKSLQSDMLPEKVQATITDVAELKTNMVLKADLETKEDKTEVAKIKATVNSVRDATTATALGKKDRALVIIYLSYKQEGNIEGFRSFLKAQGKEGMFKEIEKAAKAREEQCQTKTKAQ